MVVMCAYADNCKLARQGRTIFSFIIFPTPLSQFCEHGFIAWPRRASPSTTISCSTTMRIGSRARYSDPPVN
eukprot:6192298-Pleurochrysis_carterae.AAC.1